MATPTFRIDRDLIADGRYDASGKTFHPRGTEAAAALPIPIRLYDDDGNLYFEGAANDEGLLTAADWGMYYAGTTRLDVREGNRWTVAIG